MKCVILAGGNGDRLWPLSRRTYPKQFMEVRKNRSLLQDTILHNMPYCDEFLIVTNKQYKWILEGQLQVFQGLKYRCIYEECMGSTLGSLTMLCMLSNPSELLYVVASDIILEGREYKESVLEAISLAREGSLVLFGIEARNANPRFGYIKRDGRKVLEYHEKPSIEEAAEYVESGEYLWNSGMFLGCAGDFLQELRRYQPEVYQSCREAARKINHSRTEIIFSEKMLEPAAGMSVEKAILEHSGKLKVIPIEYLWQDIDEPEDVLSYFQQWGERDVIAENCENLSVVNQTRKQLVVANQVKDLMIINTEDALYVAPKGEKKADIRQIIEENYENYGHYFDRNRIAYRPWGNYEVLSQDNGFKVKRVTIYPGKRISSHIHAYRSEHWSVVSGNARITLDGVTNDYHTNESIYVPMGIMHEVANRTEENLIIIEVGIGETLVESDMVRREEQSAPTGLEPDSITRLEPAYKDYLWGGTRLKEFYHKPCDYDIVAESWELSAHPAGQSVLAEGRYKGMLFGEYIRKIDTSVLGWKCQSYEEFPILVKFIDARQSLSIQVHPDDAFAFDREGEYGKNEMWYIMDCEEGASLYCGFSRPVTRKEVQRAIENNTLSSLLHRLIVKPGDTVYIPAGTIHAIGEGITLCEVQQNSNSTYRIYDYGRYDKYGNQRELHLDKALEVLDYQNNEHAGIIENEWVSCEGYRKKLLGQCKYFSNSLFDVEERAQIPLEESSFVAVIVIEGEGKLCVGEKSVEFRSTDTFFIPATDMKLCVEGACQFILTHI